VAKVVISRVTLGLLAVVTLGTTLAVAVAAGASGKSAAKALVGTFKLTAGSCASTTPSGTYFRMIFPGGTVAGGKFFDNPDSTCADTSYTLVSPGTGGGFKTGTYQPNPTPAYSTSGGALADSIIQPQSFTGINFSISTNRTDPQTALSVPAPVIKVKNGKLSGQIEAWSASWNKLSFNQGSPKPGGSKPGLTLAVSGTYNAKTHAFVLIWASAVVGGPFNGFTGYWHLAGVFKAAK
jgi:hypothetical protein